MSSTLRSSGMLAERLLLTPQLCIACITVIQTAPSPKCRVSARLSWSDSLFQRTSRPAVNTSLHTLLQQPVHRAALCVCCARPSWQHKLLCQWLRHAVSATADWSVRRSGDRSNGMPCACEAAGSASACWAAARSAWNAAVHVHETQGRAASMSSHSTIE